ncbi:hypothetical protein LCGC14_1849050, partial [marine sediment metagenome]
MKNNYKNERPPLGRFKIVASLKTTVLFLIFSLYLAQANANDSNPIIQQQVSGLITDAEGVPLAGANILEKGTTNGTQTDFDGNFSLEVGDDAVLVVSYIGFATKEVSV